jgi:hypothetical protein
MAKFRVGDRVRTDGGREDVVTHLDGHGFPVLSKDMIQSVGWDGGLSLIDPEPEPDTTPTLRDHFAMAALTGQLARLWDSPDDAAKTAYQYADAMLAAREVK